MGMLDRKVMIITGASAGIGRATARLAAQQGASVVLGARRQEPLAMLAEEIQADGGHAAWLAGDVRDPDFGQQLVAVAQNRFGGVDIAFNNAGTLGAMGASHEISIDGWEQTLATNLSAAFFQARAQIPALLSRGGGSLIFTSSFVGHCSGFAGVAAYAASKAGLVGLTRALAAEYGASGLRVNALLPGGTRTAMAETMAPAPEDIAAIAGLHALKRIADPEEIARAALFLASDAASFITGSTLLCDGGVSINRG